MHYKFSIDGVTHDVPHHIFVAVCAMELVTDRTGAPTQKLQAIKLMRSVVAGLREAKDLVEFVWENHDFDIDGYVHVVQKPQRVTFLGTQEF